MKGRLKIIHLEDNPDDAELVRRALERARIHCDIRVVDSRDGFSRELEKEQVDVILSDFSMPGFDGLKALELARDRRPGVPFLFVSARIGEEAAVESLRNGASDYLVKDRLARLPAAVVRALNESDERRKRAVAETALLEREEMFAAFMNFSCSTAYLKDEEGRLVYANEPLQQWFRERGLEWHGKAPADYLPPAAATTMHDHDMQVLRTGEPLQTTENVPDLDGTARYWFICRFLVRRSGRNLLGGIGVDVTQQRLLEEQLLRAQRMESLGILAGGIAHDLNNLLLPISLGVDVLREAIKDTGEGEVLEMMQEASRRAALLIKQVLTFARGSTEQKIVISASHLIKDVAAIASRTFPANIKVRRDVAGDLASIEADPTQIHQVLMNLTVNARDAMPSGGMLTLAARNAAASEVHDHFGRAASESEYIAIEVSDSGTGIPEPVRDRVFEPFFTTKEEGKGTGLGLSTALGIIKSHRGRIDFKTEVGKGTTFSIYLPAISASRAVEQAKAPPGDFMGAAEVVLIIDDEVGPREMTKTILGRSAYQVITASNGYDGLSTFQRFRERVDAILVDHRMPLMDGPQTVQEIRKLDSQVKIIGMSGHTAHAGEEFLKAGADTFLSKPFTGEQVLSLLNTLLRSGGRPNG